MWRVLELKTPGGDDTMLELLAIIRAAPDVAAVSTHLQTSLAKIAARRWQPILIANELCCKGSRHFQIGAVQCDVQIERDRKCLFSIWRRIITNLSQYG